MIKAGRMPCEAQANVWPPATSRPQVGPGDRAPFETGALGNDKENAPPGQDRGKWCRTRSLALIQRVQSPAQHC